MNPTPPDNQAPSRVDALLRFTLPLGRQEIELKESDFDTGGMAMLTVRIREGKRFTIFDMDAVSAAAWGKAMLAWSESALAREAARQAAEDEA